MTTPLMPDHEQHDHSYNYAHTDPDLDAYFQNIKDTIQRYGVQIISIDATDYSPSFSFSIGLFERFQHPEIFALDFQHDFVMPY